MSEQHYISEFLYFCILDLEIVTVDGIVAGVLDFFLTLIFYLMNMMSFPGFHHFNNRCKAGLGQDGHGKLSVC